MSETPQGLQTQRLPNRRRWRPSGLGWSIAAIGALVLLRLWLTNDLSIAARPIAPHDDALFVRLADSIIHGHWLGKYDELTLAKGPGYPLYIAANYALHIPLLLAEQLLYISFCLLFLLAIRPWRWPSVLQLSLLASLLFHPASFPTGSLAHVTREGIYPALSGLVLACALGLLLRATRPLRQVLAWSCGLGFTFGWFWLTREEGLWLMPSVGLLLAACLMRVWQGATVDRWRRSLACLAGVAMTLVMINGVCLMNRIKYGQYTTLEFRSSAFLDAYGALTRIRPSQFHPRIPVPRESRELAYAASPTFARLRPYLDGDHCRGWISNSSQTTCEYDIAGGWFMWALRDAVQVSEKPRNAAEALRFYRTMADEINLACDRGVLPSGPRRSTLTPPLDFRYLSPARVAFLSGMRRLMALDDLERRRDRSIGPQALIDHVGAITHSATAATRPSFNQPQSARQPVRRVLGKVYKILSIVLIAASACCILAFPRWRRYHPDVVLLLLAIGGALLLRLAMLAWIDATSFAAMDTRYLSPLYVLLWLFITLPFCGALASRKAAP